jgi:hypothetical protein
MKVVRHTGELRSSVHVVNEADNTITVVARIPFTKYLDSWSPCTSYMTGDRVVYRDRILECTHSGVSGLREGFVFSQDGTVKWKE